MVKRATKGSLAKFTILGILVLMVVLGSVCFFKTRELKAQERDYKHQYAELKSESEELKQNNEKIKDYEEYTKTRKFYENVARQKLGLAYPGEVVFEPAE